MLHALRRRPGPPVKGIVQDKSGEPLIGATVQEKGNTANGTATGIDGDFALKVKSTKSVLIVSYVGMKSREVALNGRTDLTVTLEDDSELLDEVVVVGYGTMKRATSPARQPRLAKMRSKALSLPISTSLFRDVLPVYQL